MTGFAAWAEGFVERLAGESSGCDVFNPWRDRCELDLRADAPERRCERLLRHLSTPGPVALLIGEAPGYQGCRYSGIPFTSERLLCEGEIPGFGSLAGTRLTRRARPWSEPSATVVWGALRDAGLSGRVVLHNLFPWHPHRSGEPLSNRTPTSCERVAGEIWLREFLRGFLRFWPDVRIFAVGMVSWTSLCNLGVEARRLRHPAHGGAREFRKGLVGSSRYPGGDWAS